MNPADLRAYANRPWTELERMKLQHGALRLSQKGGAANLKLGYALLLHAQHVQPGYPSAADRNADLENHVRVKELLIRASRSFTRR
jgi:hypothetical protein